MHDMIMHEEEKTPYDNRGQVFQAAKSQSDPKMLNLG